MPAAKSGLREVQDAVRHPLAARLLRPQPSADYSLALCPAAAACRAAAARA